MSVIRSALCCITALTIGSCASTPHERSILDMDVEEIVSRTAAIPVQGCPAGEVEYCAGEGPGLEEITECSCVPEQSLWSSMQRLEMY